MSVPRSSASSSSRPTSAAPPVRSTATRARARSASQTGTGLDFPFASTGGASSILDGALGRAEGRLVDQDAHRRRGCALQPRCSVDDIARSHSLACLGPGVERDQRFAGRDPDADLELALLGELVPDRERRSDRTLGVVLVRDRRAEDGHDRVADELLDGASEALELRAHLRVVGLEQAAHILRIHALGACREADEVAEEAGDDLALLARAAPALQRGRALRAEACVFRVLAAAARADLHERRIGGGAWPALVLAPERDPLTRIPLTRQTPEAARFAVCRGRAWPAPTMPAMSPQRRTALISVGAACLLIAIKLAAGLASGSLGLLAEAAHSGTDLAAALLTFFAVSVAVRPADTGHPWGHGKAEHLAALAEAAFLILISGVIAGRRSHASPA